MIVVEVREEVDYYIRLHCHHLHYDGQRESHFNVSLIVRDSVRRPCPH